MAVGEEAEKLKTTVKAGKRPRRSRPAVVPFGAKAVFVIAVDSATAAGLLEEERTVQVTFWAPKALVAAAMKRSGVASQSELGILALAAVAQTDAVAAVMRKKRGLLGKDHQLEY